MLLQIKHMEKAVEQEFGRTAPQAGQRRSRALLAEPRRGRQLRSAATKLQPWEIGQAAQQVGGGRHV